MKERNFETELLYFGHGYTTGTTMHAHPYFQLEYCIEGQITAQGNRKIRLLNPGDFWLILPGTLHKFNKNKNPLNYISIKFNTSPGIPSFLGHQPVCRYYLEAIRSVIDGETDFNAYASEGKSIIENYLSGILHHLVRTEEPQSEFKTAMQRWICEFGAAANVNDLAEKFHMSRAEFKYRFQQEIGNGRIKDYIDAAILKIVEQHLCYSDVPLNKIADQLHFSSIYAFSRYYKQHRGISLSEFRRQKNGMQQAGLPRDVQLGAK